jgi:IS4 transposase
VRSETGRGRNKVSRQQRYAAPRKKFRVNESRFFLRNRKRFAVNFIRRRAKKNTKTRQTKTTKGWGTTTEPHRSQLYP